jgi:hypothetical protein
VACHLIFVRFKSTHFTLVYSTDSMQRSSVACFEAHKNASRVRALNDKAYFTLNRQLRVQLSDLTFCPCKTQTLTVQFSAIIVYFQKTKLFNSIAITISFNYGVH